MMERLFYQKIINGKETTYITNGTQILQMKNDNGKFIFHYILNKLVGFEYTSASGTREYLYIRNIQGDITSIIDTEGNIICTYAYDGYGNHIVLDENGKEDTSLTSIGHLNPFRYRGYYFDEESGLYYLNSRYYDPETGRFISPDILTILDETKGQINGLNLYMYCNDNPIMYYDPSGHIAFFVITAIIGAIFGFGWAAYNDYKEDGVWFNGSAGTYILYTLVGTAIGTVAGLASSSLLAGDFLASCGKVYASFKGLAWAYTMGGPSAAGLYMANNFFNSIDVNATWLGYWPPNNGFSGPTESITLQQGTVIQRIGGTDGFFSSAYYTDPMSLSLPYHQMSNMANPTMYIVNQPFTVIAGQVAPWFGQYGGGIQYLLPQTIQKLIELGFLSKL